MNFKALALGLALAVATAMPVAAQRGGGSWELLGEEKVGFGQDRDVIRLSHNEEYYRSRAYRKLRFIAEGGEVRMKSIRLVYLNGSAEDVSFEQNLRPGQEVDVDLRGERSYLRQIEMTYHSKFGISIGQGGLRVNQATIKVLGENVRGAPVAPTPRPQPDVVQGNWDKIATERFDRRDGRVEIRVGKREGSFSHIRLQNRGDRITVKELRVRFGNGEVQNYRVEQELSDGESTRAIDLPGVARAIENVTMILEPRKRPGSAEITLSGVPRAFENPRASWVALGQAEVGFRVDRDVIRIGQKEDWFRDRGFDKLHFVAENNDVHMISIRVVYINGSAEDYPVDRLLRAGSDMVVDLKGRRSYLREVEMIYRKRDGFGGRAIVKLFGEPPRR